ncbi:MAG: hypothetical protein HYU64_02505 [Armatimonadetes bacterium]|nr:hypothetical protein [Armatimonadota bacterium]
MTVSVAVLAFAVSGALFHGIRTWERGRQLQETSQEGRTIFSAIARDLRGVLVMEGNEADQFIGQKETLEFVSTAYPMELFPGPCQDLCRVSYVTVSDPDGGNRRFVRRISFPSFGEEIPDEEETLSSAFQEIIFEYSDGVSWLEEWRDRAVEDLPLAVRVSVTLPGGVSPFQGAVALPTSWGKPIREVE